MDIKYKMIEHERTEDAPFIGALICADSCNFKCKGCFNKSLKKEPSLVSTAKEIITEVKSNPFNEGIILGGLEWSEQPIELLELCEEADKNNLKIMIYTGCTIKEFQVRLGIACTNHVGFDEDFTKKLLAEKDDNFYAMIGVVTLDKSIKNEYYIKCGRYENDKRVENNEQFGVKLASSNQRIFKIEKEN